MKPHADQCNVDGAGPLQPSRRALLAAVADPVRLEILSRLREEKTVGQICHEMDMAQPRISHHLSVLRQTGLLVSVPRGREHPHQWPRAALGSDVRRIQDLLLAWFDSPSEGVLRAESGGSEPLEDFLL